MTRLSAIIRCSVFTKTVMCTLCPSTVSTSSLSWLIIISTATWFEELYCRIRDIAADFHREAVRRQSGEEHGQFHADDLDPQKAVDGVGKQVVKTIKDWDY